MISALNASRVCVGAAVVLLLTGLFLNFLGLRTCGHPGPGYSPIVAEELARKVDPDLHAIFGDAPSGCRTTIAQKLDLATWIDSLLFIPAYGVFYLFFFLGMVPRDERSALTGFGLSAVAIVADYAENFCLFQVTHTPDVTGLALAMLPWATGIKWIALGLAGMTGGTILIEKGGENYPAAAACGLALLGSVVAIANPHLFGPYLSGAIGLSWLVFVVVAVRGAFFSAVTQLEVEDGAA